MECDCSKQALRAHMRCLSLSLSEEERLSQAQSISQKLKTHPVILSANSIMVFYPLRDEVDITDLLDYLLSINKQVYLPKTVGDSMLPALYTAESNLQQDAALKIKMPDSHVEAITPDVILVPGVAFDKQCYRLGRGKSYYDRYLASLPKLPYTIGIAYEHQIVDSLPIDAWDIPLQEVQTANNCIK